MLLQAPNSQLVLIDFQAKLMPAMYEGAAALANAQRLAQAAQLLGVPTFGTEQVPEKLGALPSELSGLCRKVLRKSAFSAVPDGLLELLKPAPSQGGNARSLPKHLQKPTAAAPSRDAIVLAGVEAHVCLLQTALDLLAEDLEVWIVTDACTSRTERNRDAAYDRLAGNGAELVTTEMVLFEWLEHADHEHFKAVQGLIK